MAFLENFSIQKKLFVGSGVSVALLILLCLIVWRSIDTMDRTAKMVEHTYEVIEQSETLVNAMVDQETGLRGFLIGGQDDYLEPYHSGQKVFVEALEKAKQLTSDNPAQQKRYDAVAANATQWQAYAKQMIDLRQQIRAGEASNTELRSLIESGIGKQRFDGLRKEIATGAYGNAGSRVLSAMINMETGLRGFMLNRKENFLEPYTAGREALRTELGALSGSTLSNEAMGWINDYAEVAIAMVRQANQYPGIDQLFSKVAEKQGKIYMDGLRAEIKAIIDVEQELMTERREASENAVIFADTSIVVCGLLGVLLSAIAGVLIARSISRPVDQAVQAAKRIAEGDLTQTVHSDASNEMGDLLRSVESTTESLRNIIRDMSHSSESLSQASESLDRVTGETEKGATEQMDMTAQVATAMDEMSASVAEVAKNANEASESAQSARAEAEAGLSVVQSTIGSINKLETEILQSSGKLTDLAKEADNVGAILDVIRGIADQTNLLALNAAIEAARAGEQGRGFAVVADEVRSLAQRTQSSTEEIQSLIENLQNGTREAVAAMDLSRKFVDSSVDDANSSGEALTRILAGITAISDMNLQIASASQQQASVAEEINQNVTKVDDISRLSMEHASQTVESSQEMSSLAGNMRDIVAKFRI